MKPESFLKPAETKKEESEYELTELADETSFDLGELEELESVEGVLEELEDLGDKE